MKLFLFALLFPAVAHSQGLNYVQDTAISSGGVSAVWISSFSATDVVSSSNFGAVNGAFIIRLYNVIGSTQLFNCGFDVNVSTLPGATRYGVEVSSLVSTGPGFLETRILYPVLKLFCLTQNPTGSSRGVVMAIR